VKILVINGKKIGGMIIIVGLMIMMFGLEMYFDNKLKMASLIQSNFNPLEQYSALNDKLKYKLPKQWETNEKKFNSNEIIYHNEFESVKSGIFGFVQVWNKRGDLKKFLDNSKMISEKQNEIRNYSIHKIKVNNYNGYVIRYVVKTKYEKKDYIAFEYFIDCGDVYVRFSFFVKGQMYKENMQRIFDSIVETMEYTSFSSVSLS